MGVLMPTGMQAQVIDVPITGGLQERDEPKLTVNLLQCRNGLYRKNGSVGKRYGLNAVDIANTQINLAGGHPASTMPPPEECAEFNRALVRIGRGELATYSPAQAQYSFKGHVSNLTASLDYMPSQSAGGVSYCTTCVNGNYLFCLYVARILNNAAITGGAQANRGLFFDLIDLTTGAAIATAQLADALLTEVFSYPVPVALGSVFYFAYYDARTSLTGLRIARLDPAVLTPGLLSTLTDVTANAYDLTTDGTDLYLAYQNASAIDVRIRKMDTSATLIAETSNGLTSSLATVSLKIVGANACATYLTGTAIRAMVVVTSSMALTTDASVGSSSSPAPTGMITSDTSTGYVRWLIGTLASGYGGPLLSGSYVAASASVATAAALITSMGGVGLESDTLSFVDASFFNGTRTFAIVTNATSSAAGGSTKFVVELFSSSNSDAFSDYRVRAILAPSLTNPSLFNTVFGRMSLISEDAFVAPLVTGGFQKSADNLHFYTTTSLVTLTGNHRTVISAVENNVVTVSGAGVFTYDGANVFENGFSGAPVTAGSITQTTGGSLTLLTTYSYALTYGYQNAAGATEESAPFFFTAPALTSTNDSLTFAILGLALSARPLSENGADGWYVNVYRSTAANPSGYYFVDRVYNPLAVSGTAYTDTTADAHIAASAQLYTTEGTVPSSQPPASHALAVVNGRLWLAAYDGTLWPSRVFTDGDPINFYDGFALQPFENGPITALANLQGTLVIFKERAIYLLSGNGPNDQGVGSFASPQLIQGDAGCVDPKSVVAFPNGLLFRGEQGLMMLDRSFNVTPIGRPVETTVGGGTVVDACLVGPQALLRFSLSGSSTTTNDGATYLNNSVNYDYNLNSWSVDTYTGSGTYAFGSLCACIWQGQWTAYELDGGTGAIVLFQETPGAFVDQYAGSSHFVMQRLQTSFIKAAGVQGYQRVWKVGILETTKTAHAVTVNLYTDYSLSSTETPAPQTTTFSDAQIEAFVKKQYQLHVVNQKTESLSVEIIEVPPYSGNPVGTGEGMVLAGVSLQVGVERGPRRLPPAQTS